MQDNKQFILESMQDTFNTFSLVVVSAIRHNSSLNVIL